MKRYLSVILIFAMMCTLLVGCSNEIPPSQPNDLPNPDDFFNADINNAISSNLNIEGTKIVLSDDNTTVNGVSISNDNTKDVYLANDIVYYEANRDFKYGDGSEDESHSKIEAAAHQVIHITKAGTYVLSGKLSTGQIAIDLGENASLDKTAVVTLYLDGVDITCTVGPAIIFYNVYECGNNDIDTATSNVNTSNAGANVVIADNSVNILNGSHVALIYEKSSVMLNEDGTRVAGFKTLHKYDATLHSQMTINVSGMSKGNGVLNVKADYEGISSELHLTVNGGNIYINSEKDGMNAGEDFVSVITINDGNLNIKVDKYAAEGNGIDSKGWLIINDGIIMAQACSYGEDAGMRAEYDVCINGGTVFATGNANYRIDEDGQNVVVMQFMETQESGNYLLKNEEDVIIADYNVENSFTHMLISSSQMIAGNYSFWKDGIRYEGVKIADRTNDLEKKLYMQKTSDTSVDDKKHDNSLNDKDKDKNENNNSQNDIADSKRDELQDVNSRNIFVITDGINYFIEVVVSEWKSPLETPEINSPDNVDTNFTSHVIYVNWTDDSSIYDNAINATDVQSGKSNIPIYKFDTLNELVNFKNTFNSVLSFDSNYGNNVSFTEIVANYNEEFFEGNSIILLYVTSGSGSNRFGLHGIQYDETSFHVLVNATYPEIGTCDMAGWFILIEVPDEMFENCQIFTAEIVGLK